MSNLKVFHQIFAAYSGVICDKNFSFNRYFNSLYISVHGQNPHHGLKNDDKMYNII